MGSVNPNTKNQIEELWLSQRTHNVFVQTRELLEGETRREKEIERVTEEILAESSKNIVSTVVGDGIYPENRIDFTPYMEKYHCSMGRKLRTVLTALLRKLRIVFSKKKQVLKDFIQAVEI